MIRLVPPLSMILLTSCLHDPAQMVPPELLRQRQLSIEAAKKSALARLAVPTPGDESAALEEEKVNHKRAERTETVDAPSFARDPSIHSLDLTSFSNKPSVLKWIHYFSKKDRARFQRFIDRGERFRPMIQGQLVANGLPKELYYLAMIESGFSVRARSWANAVGIWQFIAPTGRRYGLVVNRLIDERRDPEKATKAAMAYISDLYRIYQSWELALSAYNAGESRVLRAIMKADTRDFWSLSDKKSLPRETRNYFPKFAAAVLIGQNPQKYGFTVSHATPYFHNYTSIEVPPKTSLNTLAKHLKVSQRTLRNLNPSFLRSYASHRKAMTVRIPENSKRHFEEKSLIAAIKKTKVRRSTAQTYRVRRGDSLHLIAKRHGTSVRKLMVANNLRTGRIYPGQKLYLTGKRATAKHYKVRRGDTLAKIAAKFNSSIRKIKRTNKLRSSRIYAGQRLKIGML